MNKLDKDYLALCQDILDNGTKKQTRNGETLSVFGRRIRHKMSDGFPLLTTKKIYMKGVITELLWFLRGDTNIRYLLDNNCYIWVGDAYKNYTKQWSNFPIEGNFSENEYSSPSKHEAICFTEEEFINKIKTDNDFAKKWGSLGPVYGKQWRSWNTFKWEITDKIDPSHPDRPMLKWNLEGIDQIADAIHKLKTTPDDRGIIVSAWNVGELEQMILRPCHNFFQFYTRELSLVERSLIAGSNHGEVSQNIKMFTDVDEDNTLHKHLNDINIPTRAISLMWNQRSVDTPLGLPFNIASYGLLLEIIAKIVNMVPDELIGNLGDCHIYSNQIDGIKEQLGTELSLYERVKLANNNDINASFTLNDLNFVEQQLDRLNVPKRTREPYPLPRLRINTEFWPTKSGECGVGELTDNIDSLINEMQIDDFQIEGYKSHPSIKMPLSN